MGTKVIDTFIAIIYIGKKVVDKFRR